jgi:diguanylate cyclase (GGDEF)-like protein
MTGMKKAEQQVAYMTNYDTLTGLPNQKLFIERLSQTLLRDRNGNDSYAIMFIDLDRFNHVNGLLGYAHGDRVLVSVSERITDCIREEDTLCWYENNVFAVLLRNMKRIQAEKVAERILNEFQKQ